MIFGLFSVPLANDLNCLFMSAVDKTIGPLQDIFDNTHYFAQLHNCQSDNNHSILVILKNLVVCIRMRVSCFVQIRILH